MRIAMERMIGLPCYRLLKKAFGNVVFAKKALKLRDTDKGGNNHLSSDLIVPMAHIAGWSVKPPHLKSGGIASFTSAASVSAKLATF